MTAEAPWKKGAKTEPALVAEEPSTTAVDDASTAVDFSALQPIAAVSTDVEFVGNDDDDVMPMNSGVVYEERPRFDSSDVFIPKLRLANGLSTEVRKGQARSGQWVLFGHDPKDAVDVIILGAAKRRELRDGSQEANLLCRSNDSKVGKGNPGGLCARCQFSRATAPEESADGKYHAPACTLIYSYQAFSLTHNALCLVEFKKTGTAAAKQINTSIGGRPPRSFVLRLDKEEQQNAARQSYWAPTVMPRDITDEELEILTQGTENF